MSEKKRLGEQHFYQSRPMVPEDAQVADLLLQRVISFSRDGLADWSEQVEKALKENPITLRLDDEGYIRVDWGERFWRWDPRKNRRQG